MTTTKKWGVGSLLILALGLLAFFTLTLPEGKNNQTFAQDATLISASTDYHPTDVFSVVHKADSLAQAFQAAGVDYFPEDKVSYFPDPNLGIGTVITVQRALPITVIDGKKSRTLRTWQTTVGSLLKEKKIELGNDDEIAPSLVTALTKNMTLTITRVARTNITETKVVPYQTKIEKDYNQFVGGQTILKAGKNGQLEETYTLIRKDGELISKTLISTKTTLAAVTAVVRQGGLNPVPSQCISMKDWVVEASRRNGIDPNALFYRVVRESNCHPNSSGSGGKYLGLLQYEQGFWSSVSTKAGYAGASIWDAKSQIEVTAWAWAHGFRGRWPSP
ncbi:MAG: G5 domain-containing protein [Candidatus Berkelbacteria bacterium]|nr:G5 domain-containing protein [Candidatus Berkelbacteria bacterium]MCR4307211.1 G5 domain-containing protein [Candidatus Berkelbacteria bacterium]